MRKILGKVMVAMAVLLGVSSLAACKKGENVKVLNFELTAESYAFAVAKGNDTVLNAANDLLAELKGNGELEKIINSFFDGSADFKYVNPINSLPTGSAKDEYLVVATNAYFPPFEYYDGNSLTGVDMKIASLLAEKMNKKLYINDMDFDAIITSVQEGMADIGMAGLTVTDTRLQIVNFTTEYYESAQVIVVQEKDELFKDCRSADDICSILAKQDKSYKIGTQNGTTGYMFSAGDADFEYDGFPNLETKGYTTGALAIKDLSNGAIQAVILDKQPAIMIAKSINK